jgi:predicted RecA/RadA family phage recombinase
MVLTMQNYVQEGKIITLTAPVGGVISGQALLVGSIFGCCTYTAAAGADVEVAVEGVFTLPKAAPLVIAQGAAVYWDPIADNVTTVATSNAKIGAAVTAAGSADTTIRVRLDGVAIV